MATDGQGLSVLVTGGAGFVGAAVIRRLLDLGHRVLALDTTFEAGRLPEHPHLRTQQGDVRDAARLHALVGEVDLVIHLAAIADVRAYSERPVEVLDVNILGTRAAALAAHAHGVPLLFASSSEAFGKNTALLHEGADTVLGPPTRSRWCYATSKLAGEHYAWGLAKQGLVAAAVRFFNAYGPTLDAPGQGRVISQFLGRLKEGRPLALVDGGHAVRCFCHIDDAARATAELALALVHRPELAGRPYNVGNPHPVTMKTLAEHVVRLADHGPGTEVVPGRAFFGDGFEEIPYRVPDISALQAAIGYAPTVDLETGLRQTLAHWGLLADDPPRPPPEPIPVIRPVYDADTALLDAYRTSLRRGWTTNAGPHVTGFEREVADWLGVDEALAVGSGADGLDVVAAALPRRGQVLLPSFTYAATLNAFERAGFEPVFVDIDPHTWTMDPRDAEARAAGCDDLAAVVAVNVYGVPADTAALRRLADAHGAALVVDGAHAFGTMRHGHRVDPHADAVVFSFHATKTLPSIEGGLVVAPDPALRARILRLRTHGLAPDPMGLQPGFNAKMDELSAATARHGLAHIDGILSRRRTYGDRLTTSLADRPHAWTVQAVPEGVVHAYQNLCVRCGDRARVEAVLDARGVGHRRYFHPPLHHTERFAGRVSLPVTDAVHADLICLPLHSRMTDRTLTRIEAALQEAASR